MTTCQECDSEASAHAQNKPEVKFLWELHCAWPKVRCATFLLATDVTWGLFELLLKREQTGGLLGLYRPFHSVPVLFWMFTNFLCNFLFTTSIRNTHETKIMPFWPLCCESEAILSKKSRSRYPGWSVHLEQFSSRLTRSRFFDGPAQLLIWAHRIFYEVMWCFSTLKLAVYSSPFLSGKENVGYPC